jgi:hypothetical protein
MKTITPETYAAQFHSFWFPAAIKAPLVILIKEMRTEVDYDSDPNAEVNALHAVLSATRLLSGKTYVVMSEANVAVVSKLRSKRGLLPLGSPLRQLEHYHLEIPVAGNFSRLGVVLVLTERVNETEIYDLLNWVNGVFVVSPMAIEDVCTMASGWMAEEVAKPLCFNYDAIAASVAEHPEVSVVRYFPADNGRPETIVAVCSEVGIKQEMEAAVER